MKAISIDIETTGLDPNKHVVLEVGAVIFDTQQSINDLDTCQKLRFLITHEDMNALPLGPYCAKLHLKLWEEFIAIKNDREVVKTYDGNTLRGRCPSWEFANIFSQWAREGVPLPLPLIAAGKNFPSFDKVFLEKMPNWKLRFAHRFLDPSMFYVKGTDEHIPSTDLCLERAGLGIVTDHTALADAVNVAKLILLGIPE